jgi:hypothetical protein
MTINYEDIYFSDKFHEFLILGILQTHESPLEKDASSRLSQPWTLPLPLPLPLSNHR